MLNYDQIVKKITDNSKYNFADITLSHVIPNEASNSVKLFFNSDRVINTERLLYFINSLEIELTKGNIKKVDFQVKYDDNSCSDEDKINIFNIAFDRHVERHVRYKSLKSYEVKFENGKIIIPIDSESARLTMYRQAIQEEINKYGVNIPIDIVVDTSVRNTSEVKEEIDAAKHAQFERNIEKQRQEVQINKPKEVVEVATGYTHKNKQDMIREISQIPIDQDALNRYEYEIGFPMCEVVGQVFEYEMKEFATGSKLFSASITDEKDSILITKWVNDSQMEQFSSIKKGTFIRVTGKAEYDRYKRDVIISKASKVEILEGEAATLKRVDNAIEKRVELHTHTKMSNLDGIDTIDDYVKTAIGFGHKAIALTDKFGVYAYPDFYKATKNKGIKPIYGLETNFQRLEDVKITHTYEDLNLKDSIYVVFDIETTGFSSIYDEIIEIACVKIKNGQEIDRFETYVKPNQKISSVITNITSITNEDVANAPTIDEVFPKWMKFMENCILVAHNASFDMSFVYSHLRCENKYIKEKFEYNNLVYPVIDTLNLLRFKYGDQLKFFNLKAMAKLFKVDLTQHHRAIYDTKATADCFVKMLNDLSNDGISNYNQINSTYVNSDSYKMLFPNHINLLATNKTGLRNIYEIVSESHTNSFGARGPVLTDEFLNCHRDGILVGSGCSKGEIFEAAKDLGDEELKRLISIYDYVEIQPPNHYLHLFDGKDDAIHIIVDIIKNIVRICDENSVIVVATGNVHHTNDEQVAYRDIVVNIPPKKGEAFHPLSRVEKVPSQYLMTTEEMLESFHFLGKDKQYEVVVKNTNKIADLIEEFKVFSSELYSPKDDFLKDKGIPSLENEMVRIVEENAKKLYGFNGNIPKLVRDRIDKELNSIISNKFAGVYFISHLLVKKSNDDGYVVGSRGSVGSSIVATLLEVTEVNALSPHYRCPECQFSAFKLNEAQEKQYGLTTEQEQLKSILNSVDCGYDLPDQYCPHCGTKMKKDGHDIPFETFLGFKGDKIPDIDLNFSGVYQAQAHNYVKELFGSDHAFRAGTIGTIAEKTAFGNVKGYLEKKGLIKRNVEISRLAKKIEGIKRTTGQHPGGIVVVPSDMSINDVTPVQYPANDVASEWKTTHFDYHSFEENLLKLDILGHDVPTIIRLMMDYVSENQDKFPFSTVDDIPLDDKEVYKLFHSTESIGVEPSSIESQVASYGLPEFGTVFVRQMLVDTKPDTFAGLVQISGLSHGTDVWLNNAKDLVLKAIPEYSDVNLELKDVIGCRDDIMVYLMYQGMEPSKAFEIMEFVRRGKPSKDKETWETYKKEMAASNVPEWYTWSCEQIKYMFPKGHATAYVLMTVRIGWFKVHAPLVFYSTYFSVTANKFDVESAIKGYDSIKQKVAELKAMQKTDDAILNPMLLALEMTARGFKFANISLMKSQPSMFVIDGDQLIIPFSALDGLGDNVANTIIEARTEKPFTSIVDLSKRTKLSKTHIARFSELGILNGLPEEEPKVKETTLFDL